MAVAPDIATSRLPAATLAARFSDLEPPLGPLEAKLAAERCLFCYDAPCVAACPTTIDIPLFIRQIAGDNSAGAAKTILKQNVFGGMCARVCPTETLCEGACVRQASEHRPVEIGRLQRHATDALMAAGPAPFVRAAPSGRRIAVVGAGPAGLACAHRLAVLGHDVTVFEAKPKAGGLNEYGLALYKTPAGFAAAELDWLLAVGGITVVTGKALGRDLSLAGLTAEFDAVFLGLGLQATNALGLGDAVAGVEDAVAYIAALRQAGDLGALPVGRRVVVIGGGMTAIDIASQIKRLGAEEVTIAYRRGEAEMGASAYEREIARQDGVAIRTQLKPAAILAENGHVSGIVLERTRVEAGRVIGTGETVTLAADQVFRAIGQAFVAAPLDGLVALEGGRIKADAAGRTSHPKVWAGGDCVAGREDLTVAAVRDGRDAALSIDAALKGAGSKAA
jgi:glutamate synthase (NADPH/NADH) small chain